MIRVHVEAVRNTRNAVEQINKVLHYPRRKTRRG